MIHVCHHSSVHAHVGPEPSSAQKRKRSQTDEELADYRQLRKLFKLEKGARAGLNRILIIKTERRSIIPGVPILGAL